MLSGMKVLRMLRAAAVAVLAGALVLGAAPALAASRDWPFYAPLPTAFPELGALLISGNPECVTPKPANRPDCRADVQFGPQSVRVGRALAYADRLSHLGWRMESSRSLMIGGSGQEIVLTRGGDRLVMEVYANRSGSQLVYDTRLELTLGSDSVALVRSPQGYGFGADGNGPQPGKVDISPDGTFTYTPDATQAAAGGTDTFVVTIGDEPFRLLDADPVPTVQGGTLVQVELQDLATGEIETRIVDAAVIDPVLEG